MSIPSATPSAAPRAAQSDARIRHSQQHHVRQLGVFRVHAAVFAISIVVIAAVNLAINIAAGIADQWVAWWSGWALIGWATTLMIHGLVLRVSRPEA